MVHIIIIDHERRTRSVIDLISAGCNASLVRIHLSNKHSDSEIKLPLSRILSNGYRQRLERLRYIYRVKTPEAQSCLFLISNKHSDSIKLFSIVRKCSIEWLPPAVRAFGLY
jgi:hypothetical protein